MLMMFSFYLNQQNISQSFMHILIHVIMSFSFEQKVNGKLSFLAVEVSPQKSKFVTTVYKKSTFSGVCTYFDSVLPMVHKVAMIYTLAYQCFEICFVGQNSLKNLISSNMYL